tara:strand:+ start:3040 stop:3882 length:843 start_codon:yes stop_codon:yes gene_type:complete
MILTSILTRATTQKNDFDGFGGGGGGGVRFFYKRTIVMKMMGRNTTNHRRTTTKRVGLRGASLTSMATMKTPVVAEVADSATLEVDTHVGLAEAPAVSVANDDDDDDDLDGIETVVLEENTTTTETDADAKTTGKMMFTEEGQPFESNNTTNAFDDGVQAASLGSQFAFALAVVLLLVITGGTLYVSAREAMDRKEESDAREEMERQERIVEANKGRLKQDANKKRKPKVRNLDKLIAEGIVEPGKSETKAKNKKLNRKERRAKRLASARDDDDDRDEDE